MHTGHPFPAFAHLAHCPSAPTPPPPCHPSPYPARDRAVAAPPSLSLPAPTPAPALPRPALPGPSRTYTCATHTRALRACTRRRGLPADVMHACMMGVAEGLATPHVHPCVAGPLRRRGRHTVTVDGEGGWRAVFADVAGGGTASVCTTASIRAVRLAGWAQQPPELVWPSKLQLAAGRQLARAPPVPGLLNRGRGDVLWPSHPPSAPTRPTATYPLPPGDTQHLDKTTR